LSATPGYEAQIKVGTNAIALVKSTQFDMQAALEDITSMLASPNGFKVFIPVLKEMTSSLAASWDNSDTNGQLALQNAWVNNTLLTIEVTPNGGTNSYTFGAYVKKISIKSDVSKVNESAIDLQPTGAPTIV
jgi:hypothetical protein